jgi:FkbM family methyltransferase
MGFDNHTLAPFQRDPYGSFIGLILLSASRLTSHLAIYAEKIMSQSSEKCPSGFLLTEILPFSAPSLHVLDIGAWMESGAVYSPLLSDPETRISGFEPNAQAREDLTAQFKGGAWFPDILGDGNTHTFYETQYPGCSSLLSPDPKVINQFFTFGTEPGQAFHVARETQVQTTRLDDVDALTDIDFVKLDIQGAELMVLEHGMAKLGKALVVQTEASFLPLYIDQPLFGEQHAFLRAHGFELHKFIDVTGRAFNPFRPKQAWRPVSQLIEADAIFVRHLTDLSKLSLDELIKTARILHDIYRSVDLVYAILMEYDRRSPILVAERYMDALRAKGEAIELKLMNVKGPY